MGTISTGTGLLSGLPIDQIVTQLMAIEARPVDALKARVEEATAQRTAFMALSAQLAAIQNAISRFDEASFFRSAKATSSNTSVLTATASEKTPTGSYTFQVQSLVATHHLVSSGMPDRDLTPVGRGTLTIEQGASALNPDTPLNLLNDQAGVQRGVIRITDRSGRSADVDLRSAFTVNDVLAAINSRVDVSVRASVQGDHFVLTDASGGTGSLIVADVGGGRTAADLGILGSSVSETLSGSAVLRLGAATPLSVLNDGNSVRRDGRRDDFSVTLRDGTSFNVNLSGVLRFETRLEELNGGGGVRLGTIRITNRAGSSAEVDLSGSLTVQDVVTRINATNLVTASLVNSSIQISDTSVPSGQTAPSHLIVEDVSGFAAQDLGIAADVTTGSIRGSAVYYIRTIGDVVRAIQYAPGNDGRLVVAIDAARSSLTLTDTTVGEGTTTITPLNDSEAAYDLGLADPVTGAVTSRRILAGMNTVLLRSLNGGAGVGRGTIEVTASDGTVTQIDLSEAETVQDVLDTINARTPSSKVRAELSSSGLGVVLVDQAGGTGPFSVADVSGTTAADLHLLGTTGTGRLASGNLQLRYVSETTELSKFNAGQGVRSGRFRITNSEGHFETFEVNADLDRTIGDVIRRINSSTSLLVRARINDTGDGILLEDLAGGTGRLKVEDISGSAAADLHLRGEAAEGQTTLDGRLEVRIEIDADDKLQDVLAKINAAGANVTASLVNDGSRMDPYRLSLVSKVSGTPGRVLLDEGTTRLSFTTLVQPRDAVVFFGSTESTEAIPVVSSTNGVSGFVEGLTLSLVGADPEPVTISVTRDVDRIISDVKVFKEAFNALVDRIETYTSYNAETNERGVLFGDSSVEIVRQRLYNAITAAVPDTDPAYSRLAYIGITIGSGGKLEVDEAKLRRAIEANPEAVEKLFTYEKTETKDGKSQAVKLGVGHRLSQVLTSLTSVAGGLLTRQDERLQERQELFNDRIAYMEKLLEQKRKRLEAQFQAMERALASLQQQQSALAGFTIISPWTG